MRVLNVGGGASREIPSIYNGWDQDLLDADENVQPDIVCDAKKMNKLPASKYDAVFCSHTLEHFHKHEVPQVLGGFKHVLKASGFAHIAVPDMPSVFRAISLGNCDIGDVFYHAGPNPITFHDVIYGWGKQIETGNYYYAHKSGFSEKTMTAALRKAGFVSIKTAVDGFSNLFAFAFKTKPSAAKLKGLGCL